jgi:hypothetical protein
LAYTSNSNDQYRQNNWYYDGYNSNRDYSQDNYNWERNQYNYQNRYFTVRTSRWVVVNNYGVLVATDDWGQQITLRSQDYDEWCVSDYFLVIRQGSNIYYKYRSSDTWKIMVNNAGPGITINGVNVYYNVQRNIDYNRYNDYYDQYN